MLGLALAVAALAIAGCGAPPVTRPREGAPPVSGGTPVRAESAPPPTLAPAQKLIATLTPTAGPTSAPPTAPPSPPALAASPASSPGLSPIVSGLQPAPGASLPAGDVVIRARVTGSSDLVDVMAFVDGEPISIELDGTAVRTKTISLIRNLDVGTHEVRVQARDERGQLGGYRWQFSVSAGRGVQSAPTARPTLDVPTRTTIPIPTRRPITIPTPSERQPAPTPSPTP